MDLATLQKIDGVSIVAGHIDYNGRNIGTLTTDGPVLDPVAEAELKAAVSDSKATAKKTRAKAEAVDAVVVGEVVAGEQAPA